MYLIYIKSELGKIKVFTKITKIKGIIHFAHLMKKEREIVRDGSTLTGYPGQDHRQIRVKDFILTFFFRKN